MWNRVQLKAQGKQALKGNYWSSVAAGVLLTLFTAGSVSASSNQAQSQAASDQFVNTFNALPQDEQVIVAGTILGGLSVLTIILLLLRIFVANPLSVGCYRFFRKNVEDTSTGLGTIGEGFGNYGHVFVTLLLRDIFIALWSILLLVPGIMAAYSYRMVPYILKDNPELGAMDVIKRSKEMMRGNRWNAFVMDLSFIGWHILGIVTFGLGEIFWVNPYQQNANAALYVELLNQGR